MQAMLSGEMVGLLTRLKSQDLYQLTFGVTIMELFPRSGRERAGQAPAWPLAETSFCTLEFRIFDLSIR
jgi:hypothetical protein